MKNFFIADMVGLGMHAFNGSVGPVALLVSGSIIVACILAVGLARGVRKCEITEL